MVVFMPHCGFLSEVSRAIAIAGALATRGVPVVFAARGGPYAHLVSAAGYPLHPLQPAIDDARARAFLDALLSMGGTDEPFFEPGELEAAVASEVGFLREVGAAMVVTGFTLSAYLSTRVVGVPLATDHGGVFVPPVLARGLCPAPVNPPAPGMARLPERLQRCLANTIPALVKAPVRQLNRHARELGVEPLPSMLSLMCGELTLVTELADVLGLDDDALTGWRPRWPYSIRSGTTFAATGPLYARLDVPIPEEVSAFLTEDEPVVYVSPTSVSEALLRSIVASARAVGRRVLVGATVHDVRDLADARTCVAGVLPNHLVMPRVAAAVIMGGQGSVQTAMASGTPFVGLPYHGEQELNVAVAERWGMALRVSPTDAGSSTLTRAIRRVVEEPSFTAAARRAAERYAGVDGAAGAAAAIVAALPVSRT
jgi:UDP:flavonoid glycosyltransferase YjiC (YdhE family)